MLFSFFAVFLYALVRERYANACLIRLLVSIYDQISLFFIRCEISIHFFFCINSLCFESFAFLICLTDTHAHSIIATLSVAMQLTETFEMNIPNEITVFFPRFILFSSSSCFCLLCIDKWEMADVSLYLHIQLVNVETNEVKNRQSIECVRGRKREKPQFDCSIQMPASQSKHRAIKLIE